MRGRAKNILKLNNNKKNLQLTSIIFFTWKNQALLYIQLIVNCTSVSKTVVKTALTQKCFYTVERRGRRMIVYRLLNGPTKTGNSVQICTVFKRVTVTLSEWSFLTVPVAFVVSSTFFKKGFDFLKRTTDSLVSRH